ncbi:MAG: DNA topoisomerase [Clostridiales bacterium]|nr:DNA topoisomerase [Clostridiales bacterium]MDY3746616.1 DNA topoisomerase [Lachnospiraceae bacterium]
MGKSLYIAEKPSVAREFAKVMKVSGKSGEGYLESSDAVVTWCVGHLVTMSYPEAYDPALKRWSLSTLPFLPKTFKYEVIGDVKKQFKIVSGLLNREDVDTIYICTDSGREGEYIYRLVDQMAGVKNKKRLRVWIDSQTEEEIRRGIEEAKDWSAYDHLSDSAYLRAKEDYLMGINFSRLLTLKYGQTISAFMGTKNTVLSVGRVMTCVLGMVVRREREIRDFVKTSYYRVTAAFNYQDVLLEGEWKAVEGSAYLNSPKLYRENGFKKREDAVALIDALMADVPVTGIVNKAERKKEKKNPPLLYNLAELQNDCSKLFKLSPDETLKAVQELYEKKLVTYPRTDARVLSKAVAKEIGKNLSGLTKYENGGEFAAYILEKDGHKGIASSRYVDDKQITDHYAIIPTGQGLSVLNSVTPTLKKVYEIIVRRFLAIFYPAAEYQKMSIDIKVKEEHFFVNYKGLIKEGYQKVMKYSFGKKNTSNGEKEDNKKPDEMTVIEQLKSLKKNSEVAVTGMTVKEGETTPPKRYNSGSMILAMENAGQLIEDEELRAQIKGCGIGTSATRAEILKKLVHIKYLSLNKKTQIITPTQLGENVYDVVDASIRPLLNAELTASWEKGLNYVAEGTITAGEYMKKLEDFIVRRTNGVLGLNNQSYLMQKFRNTDQYYKKK